MSDPMLFTAFVVMLVGYGNYLLGYRHGKAVAKEDTSAGGQAGGSPLTDEKNPGERTGEQAIRGAYGRTHANR